MSPDGTRVFGPADVTLPENRLAVGNTGTYWGPAGLGSLNPATEGDDILLTNVVSFEVRLAWTQVGVLPQTAFTPAALNPAYDYPYQDLPMTNAAAYQNIGVFQNAGVFDTGYLSATGGVWPGAGSAAPNASAAAYVDWTNSTSFLDASMGSTANKPPLRVNVQGVQVRLRIWDDKTSQTRQITIATAN